MNRLEPNWFLAEPIDFEQKVYELKAYASSIRSRYSRMELYPALSEVRRRSEELRDLLERERSHVDSLRAELVGVDLKKMEYIRKREIEVSQHLREVGRIVEYSLPRLMDLTEEGQELEEILSSDSELYPVGLEPIYKKEGYLLISAGTSDTIPVYRFRLGLYGAREFPLLDLSYLTSFGRSIRNTFEHIKQMLINTFRDFPNPSTYVLLSEHDLPVQAALLPVARNKLVKRFEEGSVG